MSATKPAAAAGTPTLHAASSPQGTPGQPVPATPALTAAQRQRAYRQRAKRAVTQAIGDEAHASRVTLLALLGLDLALLDDRIGSHSTLITSQLPVKAWHTYLNDPTLADAILDRIVHSSHKIELKAGKSMRDTEGAAQPGVTRDERAA